MQESNKESASRRDILELIKNVMDAHVERETTQLQQYRSMGSKAQVALFKNRLALDYAAQTFIERDLKKCDDVEAQMTVKDQFLQKLYDIVKKDTQKITDSQMILREWDLDAEEFADIADELDGEGLIRIGNRPKREVFQVSITYQGVLRLEEINNN